MAGCSFGPITVICVTITKFYFKGISGSDVLFEEPEAKACELDIGFSSDIGKRITGLCLAMYTSCQRMITMHAHTLW